MCGKDTKDPIAERVYAEDKFIILRHGRSRNEVKPGDLIRLPKDDRDAVFEKPDELFTDLPNLEPSQDPYRRLNRNVKSTLSGGLAASLSQSISTETIDHATIKALAEAMNSAQLEVSLSGCVREHVSLSAFEKAFTTVATATPLFRTYEDQRQRFALVVETLTAKKVVITFDEKHSAALSSTLDAPTLAKLSMKLDEKASTKASIEMEPIEDGVVIALKAVEIVRDGGRFKLLGFKKKPKQIREGNDEEIEFTPLDLATEKELLADVSLPAG